MQVPGELRPLDLGSHGIQRSFDIEDIWAECFNCLGIKDPLDPKPIYVFEYTRSDNTPPYKVYLRGPFQMDFSGTEDNPEERILMTGYKQMREDIPVATMNSQGVWEERWFALKALKKI